jgi:predicted ATPase
MGMRLQGIHIAGYKALKDFHGSLGSLEVFVGANGTGKTSLFEFLRFLRDGMSQEIPTEIIPGSLGQQIFRRPGPDRIHWALKFENLLYSGRLDGPIGQPKVASEAVQGPQAHLSVKDGVGFMGKASQPLALKKPNQLALSLATNPRQEALYQLRDHISDWRFYSSFKIANEKIRQPAFVEQEPVLQEDAGNLSAVLHYLYTEHPLVFDDFQQHLRAVVPGFKSLSVKARGGPGQVLAFWREEGAGELTLADLSDGILRLLCWIVLCVHPKPSGLICIDEPDQGVHPRTLPLLAGLFEKAADRTQILLATHASYFLLQFGIERIAVLRKEDGEVKFFKPKDSEALTRSLEDFGPQEIEVMHRSDELEQLA